MDTTMMSEIEYINILPADISKLDQMLDDSSFLKGSFADNKSGIGRTAKKVESLELSKVEE